MMRPCIYCGRIRRYRNAPRRCIACYRHDRSVRAHIRRMALTLHRLIGQEFLPSLGAPSSPTVFRPFAVGDRCSGSIPEGGTK